VFDQHGALVANAPHIPVHLGSMGDSVVSLLEAVCTGAPEDAPAYIDVALASWQRSANLRQKVLLCVDHPAQA
jgi:5-oxoprolinase (ATP-hydrolysing)